EQPVHRLVVDDQHRSVGQAHARLTLGVEAVASWSSISTRITTGRVSATGSTTVTTWLVVMPTSRATGPSDPSIEARAWRGKESPVKVTWWSQTFTSWTGGPAGRNVAWRNDG